MGPNPELEPRQAKHRSRSIFRPNAEYGKMLKPWTFRTLPVVHVHGRKDNKPLAHHSCEQHHFIRMCCLPALLSHTMREKNLMSCIQARFCLLDDPTRARTTVTRQIPLLQSSCESSVAQRKPTAACPVWAWPTEEGCLNMQPPTTPSWPATGRPARRRTRAGSVTLVWEARTCHRRSLCLRGWYCTCLLLLPFRPRQHPG